MYHLLLRPDSETVWYLPGLYLGIWKFYSHYLNSNISSLRNNVNE